MLWAKLVQKEWKITSKPSLMKLWGKSASKRPTANDRRILSARPLPDASEELRWGRRIESIQFRLSLCSRQCICRGSKNSSLTMWFVMWLIWSPTKKWSTLVKSHVGVFCTLLVVWSVKSFWFSHRVRISSRVNHHQLVTNSHTSNLRHLLEHSWTKKWVKSHCLSLVNLTRLPMNMARSIKLPYSNSLRW
mgnify:CR=1 FL=1